MSSYSKTPKPVMKKYYPDYNKYGFIMAGSDVDLKTQMVSSRL